MKTKVLYSSLLLLLLFSTCSVKAQNAIYVYRNDGQFNAFFKEDVDSIVYSQLDVDSVMHDAYVVQEIHTPDSVYRIPINAIDSIGFRQPETIYEKDVVHMYGEILDNIIEVSDYTLVFSPSTPSNLLPKVGDKLAALEETKQFPLGFAGKVANITSTEKGFVYECDTLFIDEVASKFFGIMAISNLEDTGDRLKVKREGLVYTPLPIPDRIPLTFDVESDYVISKLGEIADINPGFKIEGYIEPIVKANVSIGLFKNFGLFQIDLHTDSYIKSNLDFSLLCSFNKKKSKDIFSKTIPVYGIPIYIEAGVKGEFNFDVAATWNDELRIHHIGTVSFNPNFIANQLISVGNVLTQKGEIISHDLTFKGIIGTLEAKGGGYFDVGLGFKYLKMVLELELGAKFETSVPIAPIVMKDFVNDFMKKEINTDFYDKYKDYFNYVLKPYLGIYGVLKVGKGENTSNTESKNIWETIKKFFTNGWEGRLGADFDIFSLKFYEGHMFPEFRISKNNHTDNIWSFEMDLLRNCLPPYALGYELYDTDDNFIDKFYHNQLFYNILGTPSFKSYPGRFTNLSEDKKYKVYPIFNLFGNDVLASPVIMMNLCPDDNHPHAIDLGLPSGTLWSCQNIGADLPNNNGKYLAWGEQNSKQIYDEQTYRYYDINNYEYIDIGDHIDGTRYDVAANEWKEDWRMPTSREIEELCKLCKHSLLVLNNTRGIMFEGENGNAVFFPFAGDMHGNDLTGEGQYGYYWSGTQAEGYDYGAYTLFLTDKPSATRNYGHRHLGRSVRPVCNKPKINDRSW